MSNKPQNVKGMRDHLPQAMILRQYIINTLIAVFERHGFEPLQTPIIEYDETLEGKIGDDEKLIYRFMSHGDRKLALRYDQTVPLARVVAQYGGQLVLPWRRYAVGQSYRGERQQRGRYREFWQADIDIVGSSSPIADAEIISTLDEALSALGFRDFTTMLNHRQILSGMARMAGLDDAAAGGVYRAIDKLDKIGVDGVRGELLKSGVPADATERILTMIALQGNADDVLAQLGEVLVGDERATTALGNLRAIVAALREIGVPESRYTVSPSLARGLSYYTGSVFETAVANPPMGSLLGGGRYDELVGMFAGQSLPTVGLAFGIERLFDVMTELGMGPGRTTVSDVLVTVFSPEMVGTSLQIASELRSAGVRAETTLDPGDKLGKQFKYADRKGIGVVIVIGPDEQARNEVVVKQLRKGEQQSVSRDTMIAAVREALDTSNQS